MNELQVKTIEIKPAVIEFNHEDIQKELESSLKKYEGLVFTEDSATDLRKTLAELRKGKNAVDRYRIDTKKALNEPVSEFERKCKQLDKYFNDVITPLTEQQKEFEERRRAEKLAQLEVIRLEHIKAHDLDEEYHERVVIDDSMLPKSASLKMSGDSLEFQVKNLKMEQDKKAADKELIITTVKLANSENDLSLSADAYVRLVEFTPFEQVKSQIEDDAEKEVAKREYLVRIEKERIEREEQAELERVEQEEQQRVERENKAEQERIEQEAMKHLDDYKEEFEKVQKVVEEVPLSNAPESESIEMPFADDPFLDDPFASVEKEFEVTYKIKTKGEVFLELDSFLLQNGISFEVIK